jgi:hypothetical protein
MADGNDALPWRRASRCEAHACVEVALSPDGVRVRGSRDPGTVLLVSPRQWREFCAAAAAGEFDLPAR